MFRRVKNQPVGRRPVMPSSRPASVFSYYANRSREADSVRQYSSTVSRQQLISRQWLRNLPAITAVVIIIGSVIYCLGLSTKAKVMLPPEPKTDTLLLRDKATYQQGAQKILQQSWLNRSKLTFDANNFANKFTAQFPEVAAVSIAMPLVSRHPVILLQTTQPAVVLTSGGQSFVVDKRGVVIFKAADLDSSVRHKLPVVYDETGLRINAGEQVLSKQYIEFITTIAAQLQNGGLTVATITLPPLAEQINVRLMGLSYLVKYSVNTDAKVATGTFLAAKQRLDNERVTPAEYIDVRVEERAYYK